MIQSLAKILLLSHIGLLFNMQHVHAYRLQCSTGTYAVQIGGLDRFNQDLLPQWQNGCSGRTKVDYSSQGWLPHFTNFSVMTSRSLETVSDTNTDPKASLLAYQIQQPLYKFSDGELHVEYAYQKHKAFLTNNKAIRYISSAGTATQISPNLVLGLERIQSQFGISFHLRPKSYHIADQIILRRITLEQPLQIKLPSSATLSPSETFLFQSESYLNYVGIERHRQPRGWYMNWGMNMQSGETRILGQSVSGTYQHKAYRHKVFGLGGWLTLEYKKRINRRWHWFWKNKINASYITPPSTNKDDATFASLSLIEFSSTLALEATF